MTADMVLEEVMRDEGIYRSSGGGVTMTGGEPLAQPEFLLELLTAAKERGLHTVMESSMFAEWDKIQACLPYLDVLFMDMKLLPEEKHVKYTGVSNQIILDNFRRAAAYPGPIALNWRSVRPSSLESMIPPEILRRWQTG